MKIHVPLELRWSDQDTNHHVNNATIVTLLEEVRMRAPKDITDGLRVVRTLEVRYDGELTYGQPVDGYAWISKVGNTSYEVSHELVQNQEVKVFATTIIVALDPDTRRPTPVKGLTDGLP